MHFLVAWRPLLASWFPLAVAGVVAATLASIVGGNAASRMLVPLTLVAGVACWLTVRARRLQRSAPVG
jgi:hypothetical protein